MQTFKQAFCCYHNCKPEEYIHRALSKSFYLHGQLLYPVLRWLETRTLSASIAFIRDVGECRTHEELRDTIRLYHYGLEHQGTFLARVLKLRASARKVMKLHAVIRQKQRYASRETMTSPALAS